MQDKVVVAQTSNEPVVGGKIAAPKPLLLYGASGYALSQAFVLRHAFAPALVGDIVAYVDDFAVDGSGGLGDRPVLSLHTCRERWPEIPFLIAVGDPRARSRLVDRVLAAQGEVLSFYDDRPLSLFPGVDIAAGCFVGPNTYIGSSTRVGCHTQIMSNCSIGHDVVIDAFCTICPSCTVSGYAEIGEGVFLGAGTTIVNGCQTRPLRVGRGAVLWAGSVVTTDVPPGATFVGNPAVSKRDFAASRRSLRKQSTEAGFPNEDTRQSSLYRDQA